MDIRLCDIIKQDMNFVNVVFMRMAFEVSKLSKDTNTKVGAVLVSPNRRSLSVGYNGFPPGFPDHKDWISNRNPDIGFTKYELTNHAERNAIDQCFTNDVHGWTLYSTHKPCIDCARAIITKKIKTVYWAIGPDNVNMDLKSDKVDKMFEIAGTRQIQLSKEEISKWAQ